ncbi:tetratricopeptide repeat protein [Robiginitalea sp. M366]|uniref:tetratricopeptide repeat protein n=1 Tax=Robiginitalea aestuariiviva TaxID=3036903 RepID=UPI00240E4878|nr:tetratricopeptide repeat protein [Robiginitalea aestuariiviva]MDG1572201.1 tetratricopeptide repeat protein [Robiginitalea aestuariiviva]
MRKKCTVLLALAGFLAAGYGQQSIVYTHPGKTYQEALDLYHNKQYQASQTLFQRVKAQTQDPETEANSAYYIANAAVRLNQVGADQLMEDFVEQYPTSVRRNSAFMDVADYYFENGRYPYALKWYKRVEVSSLSRPERERYDFNMGYALFSSKKPKEAERYLQRVSNSAEYGSQAKYYLGYIAYQQDDYEAANQRFDQITDQEVLQEKLAYYQADMNFKLGNFEEAIAQGKKQLPKSDRRETSELNKIIGESYFNLGQYDNAVPYLQEYKGKRGRWSNTDYYLLGYSFYKQGAFEEAVQQFNKIIGGDDAVAQNAYYHLAECYLELDKKQEALNAFRNAWSMPYNEEIRRDALLNYARLGYEIGNPYEPVPKVLGTFLEEYPESEYRAEIQELLVDSYITSRNFEGAMSLLEANPRFATPATYQKVAFYRGSELFLAEDYAGALEAFQKAVRSGADPVFTGRSQFWLGESAYALGQYQQALAAYQALRASPVAGSLEETASLDYQAGYAHFKLKQYQQAAERLRAYARRGQPGAQTTDAWMRLGDSYFVSSRYANAIEAYDQALASGSPERDYAAYQKAMSLGFLGRESAKRESLVTFIGRFPNSSLKDDALFELGGSHANAGDDAQAIAFLDRLIAEHPRSALMPGALMRKGLIYYNGGRNQEALEAFQEVVSRYPRRPEAVQAVQTAKLIYVDMGQVDAYARWVRGLDFVEVTDSELEAASYEAADKPWVEGNTDAARRALEKYLEQFPSGANQLEARFRLAQLYYADGRKADALELYRTVAEAGGGETGEQALTRVCEILVSGGDTRGALPYLQRLEATADIPQNRTFAQSNLMKGYYESKDYVRTLEYAEKVLASPSLDDRIRSDAQVMIARSARETGNMQKAREAYARVLEIGSGATAAEALYFQAFFKREDGDYEGSNTAVQRLAKDFAAYREWGGKGLVLMAKNFDALEDAFQATYILENVVANFGAYPDLVEEAQTELTRIKNREAERNASVNPEENN